MSKDLITLLNYLKVVIFVFQSIVCFSSCLLTTILQKVINRPEFCLFETKIGHLDRIMEKKRNVLYFKVINPSPQMTIY